MRPATTSGALPAAALLLALLGGCAAGPADEAPPGIVGPAMPRPASPGAIYRSGQGLSLFQDRRARAVGDTLTVRLVERTSAQKSASTNTSKETNVELPNPTLFGRAPLNDGRPALETSIEGAHDFAGNGGSSQSNQLEGNITVTVTERLANGNLVIAGEKWVTINQGREYVKLRGMVRPDDIQPDNTVASSRVAQAQIVYGGKGAVADSNAMGWAARFFNSPWWPF